MRTFNVLEALRISPGMPVHLHNGPFQQLVETMLKVREEL